MISVFSGVESACGGSSPTKVLCCGGLTEGGSSPTNELACADPTVGAGGDGGVGAGAVAASESVVVDGTGRGGAEPEINFSVSALSLESMPFCSRLFTLGIVGSGESGLNADRADDMLVKF